MTVWTIHRHTKCDLVVNETERRLCDEYKIGASLPKPRDVITLNRPVDKPLRLDLNRIDRQRELVMFNKATGKGQKVVQKKHYTGTKCALKSMNVTTDATKVTCKRCLKAMKRGGMK
jgi:hypothetical protein